MKIHFGFSDSNGTPPVNVDISVMEATPFELIVAPQGSQHSRRNALNAYLQTLNYMFRGVANLVSSDLVSVSVEKSWFGKMEKKYHHVEWTAVVDKTFIVIYDICLSSVKEHMYIADALQVVKGKDTGSKNVKPVWIDELLNPSSKNERVLRDQNIKAVEIATKYLNDYRLVYGYGGQNGLTILSPHGKPIKVDEIDNDESFVLVCLLTLLLSKGNHWGVFMLDCRGFSSRLIQGIIELARSFFGDAYIFLYNCPANLDLKRVKLNLPNFYNTGNR